MQVKTWKHATVRDHSAKSKQTATSFTIVTLRDTANGFNFNMFSREKFQYVIPKCCPSQDSNVVYSTNETDNEVASMLFKLESVNNNIISIGFKLNLYKITGRTKSLKGLEICSTRYCVWIELAKWLDYCC